MGDTLQLPPLGYFDRWGQGYLRGRGEREQCERNGDH
jgi:hypothetical protein